ncbi:MAG TPA: NYN domain-containing protein, partial [Chromatiaceae bacterium]|nr:NYN domain-containing protein [Chromatiaceae bacterium]
MNRVISYIDGFNLYFGLRNKGWKRYYWLDLVALSESILKSGQTLVESHNFTARIRTSGNNRPDMQRQADYLDALSTLPKLSIHYGHYLRKQRQCRNCGAQ